MIVQIRNPKTDRWVKLNRTNIIACKKSPGPYKGIQIVGKPIKISFLSKKRIPKRGSPTVPPKLSFLARR